ncbi:MAG TPA: general secretion pathway protein GspB [Cellvibrionaceae bacterium]
MSLLLEALRKADQERQAAQQVPGLNAQHDLPRAFAHRALLGWLVVLVAALLLVLLVWWWVALVKQSPTPVVTEAMQNSTKIEPINEPLPILLDEPIPEEVDEPMPISNPNPLDNSLPALLPEPNINTDVQQAPVPVVKPPGRFDAHYQRAAEQSDPSDAEDEAIQQLYQQPAVQSEPVAPAAVLPEQPVIGGVRDLPLSVQNRVPTLMYSAHFYESQATPSVILNGQRLYKGGTISGMKVEDVHADGVVLRLNEHVFKLNALNSWVNM